MWRKKKINIAFQYISCKLYFLQGKEYWSLKCQKLNKKIYLKKLKDFFYYRPMWTAHSHEDNFDNLGFNFKWRNSSYWNSASKKSRQKKTKQKGRQFLSSLFHILLYFISSWHPNYSDFTFLKILRIWSNPS